MRILFALNTTGFLRHFEQTVAELTAPGHSVTLAITDKVEGAPPKIPDSLRGSAGLRIVEAPFKRDRQYRDTVRVIRSFRDYARYHGPQFAGKDAYRARALAVFLRSASAASRPPLCQ